MDDSQLDAAVRAQFGVTPRPAQRTLIRRTLEGRNSLGIMPTGAGKSLAFQAAGALMDGAVLVVSPLLSLMRDQVEKLKTSVRAARLDATLERAEAESILRRLAAGDLDLLYADGRLELEEAAGLPTHTGLVLLSERGSGLGRVAPDKSVRLVRGDRDAFGVHGRSAEQRVAIDLLLDPEVAVVALDGPAGTGKTLLAIAAGLEQVWNHPPTRRYERLAIYRPVVAVGRQDMGFLPGTLEEKLDPWMGAVHDAVVAMSDVGARARPTRR